MSRFGVRVLRIGASLALILCLILACQSSPASATTFTNVYLVGPGGIGGITTISDSGTSTKVVGNIPPNYSTIQTFIPTSGILTQIIVKFLASVGSPTGTVTWNIYENSNGEFGDLVGTGSFTPEASSVNTITVSDGPFLLDNSYIIELIPTNIQSSGNYWTIAYLNTNPYPDGRAGSRASYDVPVNENLIYGVTADLYAEFTTVEGSPPASLINDKLAQPFIVSETVTISGLKLSLKKGGTPTGIDTLRLETDLGNMPSGTLIDANATGTINEEDLTTDYAVTEFTFADDVTLPPGKYWPVLSTDRTDPASWVAWAAAEFCPSDGASMRIYNQDVWQPIQVVGLWEPVVVSVELPATEEPSTGHYITLTSGQAASIDYTLTAGDSLIALLLLLLIGLIGFALVVLATKRRT